MRKDTRHIMGMHITVEVVDASAEQQDIDVVFDYFTQIDLRFSTYKPSSEISQINRGELKPKQYSQDMKTVLALSEETKKQTGGYFDIYHNGKLDPSGLVKGWAILRAAQLLKKRGFENFSVDAGGDVQLSGKNSQGKSWRVGIRNPFSHDEIVKVLGIYNKGVATSGISERGQHIYNPHNPNMQISDIASLTVIGPNVYEADRFATAAFAMGKRGIQFLEKLPGFEAYMINNQGIATSTTGFNRFILKKVS